MDWANGQANNGHLRDGPGRRRKSGEYVRAAVHDDDDVV